MFFLTRKYKIMIANPILDSEAAIVRIKNEKTCP